MDKTQMLEVGKIVNTHGLKGEMKIVPWTDTPDIYEDLKFVYCEMSSKIEKLEIRSVKYQKENLIVKFKNINFVDEAEKYKGTVLYAMRDDLGELEEGVYYIQDLIGLDVVTDDGSTLGVLSDVLSLPANDVYVVKMPNGKECLLPVIDEVILDIDLEKKVVTVHVLEGLL